MTTEIEAAIEALEVLADAYKHSTKGEWQKGRSTHHTVTETGYRIAEFHHADDANFCDVAHKYAPQLIEALAGLRSLKEQGPVAWLRESDLRELADCNYMHIGADSPKIWWPFDIALPTPDMGLVPVFTHPAPSVNAQNPTNVGALALNWYDQTMEDEGVITRDALHMFALSLPVSPAPSVSAQESEIVLSRESFLMMGQRIAELEDELHEQARVNGMGSEREAALMAKVERKDAALRVALEALESEDCINVLMQDAIDLIKRELSITSAIPGDTK